MKCDSSLDRINRILEKKQLRDNAQFNYETEHPPVSHRRSFRFYFYDAVSCDYIRQREAARQREIDRTGACHT